MQKRGKKYFDPEQLEMLEKLKIEEEAKDQQKQQALLYCAEEC